MPTVTIFARNLRKFRKKAKMSQMTLAHAVGYKGPRANSFVCAVERGRRTPRLEMIRKLAAALDVPLVDLLT